LFKVGLAILVIIVLSLSLIPILSAVPTGVFESEDFSVSNLRTGEYDNRIVIAGTIKNVSDEPISGISFVAQTFNATNELTGTIAMSGPRLPLEPQQEYSFEIPTSSLAIEVDHYTVSVSSIR